MVIASGGYPGSYTKGYEIEGLKSIKDGIVFHAGTKYEDSKIITNGGRVLVCAALGQLIEEAREMPINQWKKLILKGATIEKISLR